MKELKSLWFGVTAEPRSCLAAGDQTFYGVHLDET